MIFFSVANFMADEDATSKPLPLPSLLNPYSAFTDILLKEHQDMFNEAYKTITEQDILIAKSEGLEAVKKYINSQRHNFNKGFDWRYMAISNETANQLLNGKFETYDEMKDFEDEIDFSNKNVYVLYKKCKNEFKDRFDYSIETVFINE